MCDLGGIYMHIPTQEEKISRQGKPGELSNTQMVKNPQHTLSTVSFKYSAWMHVPYTR